ncbi:DUF7544 domain-containing protein [Anaerolinea thermophila]|uniref:Hypothetical membrane protein n=1 Tax=Anaerolinea thermophila (strain DSM 14523 / JCM 11388 / NBRC 100420 / UNI-1) TaxID=926569 RepID=E8MZM8_ANATU|nr:hypothetical protein [Anaerolinea thermophila]BAJ64576.1 hypothetical membrane protein [Anaerolinea thermophila UNI-1]
MSYGEVLSKAWQMIWKHKVLWIFGILAGFLSNGGNPDLSYREEYRSTAPNVFGYRLEEWLNQNFWLVALIVLAVFVLVLVLLVLGTFGRIGLVRGAWKADEGAVKLSFAELWAESGAYFWRVLGLSFLLFVVFLIVGVALGIFVVLGTVVTLGIGLICLLPFLCLLIPLAWLLQVWVEQVIVAMVGENLSIGEGISRAWQVFTAHLGEYIVMGLVLGLGSLVVRIVLSIPFLIALAPLLGAWMFNGGQVFGSTGMVLTLVLMCVYLPVYMFLNGILTAYLGTSWTLIFRRLTGRTAQPEVVEVLPVSS